MRKQGQVQRRIFQVAYYESLLTTRAALLEQSGYAVSSALGNERATAAGERLLANTDAVLVGFSGPYRERMAVLRWLKEQRPDVPVLVLQAHASEAFAEADGVALHDNPKIWLAALAGCIEHRRGP